MVDLDSILLVLYLIVIPVGTFIGLAYFDWASKHMDKAPEWVRKSLERQKRKKK